MRKIKSYHILRQEFSKETARQVLGEISDSRYITSLCSQIQEWYGDILANTDLLHNFKSEICEVLKSLLLCAHHSHTKNVFYFLVGSVLYQ